MRVWAILLALALGATGCAATGVATGRRADTVGLFVIPPGARTPAPDLSGTTLSGAPLDVADRLGGSTIAVNVWASWCAPCRQEMPLLVRAAARHRSGLQVVGIDERDRRSSARTFASSLGVTYPSLVDSDSRLLMKLPMLPHDAIPSTLFIDGHGRVAAWVVGPLTSRDLTSVLSRVEVTS
jgi:thiol-disulfide isomerase/thioredoxin